MVWQSEVEGLFRKLRPILGSEIDALWIAYNTQTDVRSRMEILGVLYSLASKCLGESYEKKLLLSVPESEAIDGEYKLAKVVYAGEEVCDFGLRESEWIRHIAVFGATGSGKTNCAYIILRELARKAKPFLVFDWKRSYRDLLSLDEFEDTLVFTVGRDVSPFYFNPLIPPEGTKPETWLKKLIEVMCHAYFLGEGVAYLLQKAIDRVYEQKGVYSETRDWPTFKDVLAEVEKFKAKGRQALWMDSTLRTLGVLCFGEFGRVLNSRQTIALETLLNKKVILELDALTNSDKTFFTEALLLWIHHFRLSEGNREVFKHAIVIEEAHHILLRKKQEIEGREAVTDVMLREIRELGEAIVLIDQHPSLISLPALGNTYATICFGLKHKEDMQTISESILLERSEVDFLGQLETGYAIVKLQGRFFKPFLVRFPLFEVEKGKISDDEIRRRFRSYSAESEVVRVESEVSKVISEIRGLVNKERSGGASEELSEEERKLLEDIACFPISGVVERYERIGLNRYQGNKVQRSLLSKGLIAWRTLSTRNGRIKVLVLTSEGKKAIPDVRVEKVFHKNAGFEHETAKARVAEYFRKRGYSVTFEYKLSGGKAIDLVAEKEGKRIAIEVETGKSDSLYNVRKAIEAGFDEVVVVAVGNQVKKKIFYALSKNSNLPIFKKIKLFRFN